MRLVSHPATKWLFLVVSVVAGVAALVVNWSGVMAALRELPPGNAAGAMAATFVYVFATMLCWRSIVRDLGSPLPLPDAARLFFVSQVGKYIPGGVWNVLAVSEMGREYAVPRRASLGGMLVFWLVSVTTGLLVGGLHVAATQVSIPGGPLWLVLGLAVGLILLSPPVLRFGLRAGLHTLKRPPLVREPTSGGLLRSVGWAMVAWLAAGLHVWLLAAPLSSGSVTVQAAVSAYALAWSAGFLVIVAPAGAGVREVVLAALLAGSLSGGAVVMLVLISRFMVTLVDVLLAGAAALTRRPRTRGSPDLIR